MSNSLWQKYAKGLIKYKWLLALSSIALFVAFAAVVRTIPIYSDFKMMLPQDYRSVVELNRIESRVKSTTNLMFLVGGDDWPAMRRFIDDFVAAVPDKLGDLIDGVEYNGKTVGEFFEKNKYLYVDLKDLQEIHVRLKRHIDYEKIRKSALFVELDSPPKFDVSDIEGKYKHKVSQFENYRDGYFTNPEATLAAVILKPKAGATNVAFAKELLARVRKAANELHPEEYHPSIKIAFGGRFPKTITEFDTVVGDMIKTLVLCIILIGGVVFAYFRKIRVGGLMITTAALGTISAIAIAKWTIGYLTAQTAFLGSIIIGNGINYSLIVMARYLEERRDRNHSREEAFVIALTETWKPTLVSAITTTAAFAALGLTNIRGLAHFGFIGGIGMLLCWIVTYTFMPAWLMISETIWPLKIKQKEKVNGGHFAIIMRPLAKRIVDSHQQILKYSSVIACISLLIIVWYIPNSLEYNFKNLRFKPVDQTATWEAWARDHTDQIFGQSASPAVILAEKPEQVREICEQIEKKAQDLETTEGFPILDECKSLFTYVPEDQNEKLAELANIRKLIEHQPLNFLESTQRQEIDKFLTTKNLQTISVKDVPNAIVDNFRESDGREGLVIYVYPTGKANLWDGRELVKFASLIREIHLKNGHTIYASGEAAIFSDLLQAVVTEGPVSTIFSFLAVLLVIWLTFRRQRRGAFIVMASLTLGIIWMIALLPIVGVKLNFLNFVALPIAFGIGVDYAVNIYQRHAQDGKGSVAGTVENVGGAILLCSLTTIFGYAVLMISRNQGLASLGLAALMGEFACLTAALIVLPAYLRWREQNR